MVENFTLKRVMTLITSLCLSCLMLFSFSGCTMLKRSYSRDLIAAIKANDMEKLQALVDKGGDLDMLPLGKILADGFSRAPLTVAVVNANFEAVKILIEAGADPNVRSIDSDKSTPLHQAIIGCTKKEVQNNEQLLSTYYDIAYYLMDNGADIHLKDNLGDTAICNLVGRYNGREQEFNLFLYLLEKGAKIDEGFEGHIMIYACRDDSCFRVVKYLFENYKIDVNMRSQKEPKDTLLMQSCGYGGAPQICRYLLEHGADKDLKNTENETAYMIAEKFNREAVLEVLMQF